MIVPISSTAAETEINNDDWRFQFIKKRYAKLFEILSVKLTNEELTETLHQLGAYCASTGQLIQKHRGDIDGFIQEFKELAGDDITYDREEGLITIKGKDRGECYCPMIDKKLVSEKICDCSLGWQEYTYENLLGKKVKAELKESIVLGSTRCSFQIRVLGN
jgi:hypothetical protein